MASLVFLRRTAKEAEVFGGDVYFDIDGKNIGKLSSSNQEIELPAGEHKIKMYKSHMYDSFIGLADAVISLADDEKLMVQYSAPMMISQPGNIIISQHNAEKEAEVLRAREDTIHRDFIMEEMKKQEQDKKYSDGAKTFIIVSIIITVIIGVIYCIFDAVLWDSIG